MCNKEFTFRGGKLLAFFALIVFNISCTKPIIEGNRNERDIKITDPYLGTVSISFQLINNLIIIPAKINNSKELNFILDTGAGRTIITELDIDQGFKIDYEGNVELQGLGTAEPLQALISRGNKIYLTDIEGENHTIVFLLEDRFNLSTYMGTRVNGLLGSDLFKNFIVEVDYDRRKVHFHDPDFYRKEFRKRKKSKDWSYLPLELINDKLYTQAIITQNDSSQLEVKLLIDSGASHTVFLYTNTNDEIKIPSNSISSYLGTGLSGKVYGEISSIEELQLGGYEIEGPIVSYPYEEAISKTIYQNERNGSLGGDILKRFDIIFNYQDGGMLIRRNKKFKDSFRYNASGVEITTPVLDLPYYLVSEVRENSPGDQAGLEKGDIILWVGTKQSFKYSLNELIDIFHTMDEKNISLIVQRGTEKLRVTVKIKNELE
jgi:hypothetical protein